MGVTANTTCRDCGKGAPEVGDFGYIGYPSLSTSAEHDDDAPVNFGYLYQGFQAIHLLTADLERMREFLEAHKGHDIHTFIEGEPAFGDGEEDAEDNADYEEDDFEGASQGRNKWLLAHYCLKCSCGADYSSEYSDNFVPFKAVSLDAKAVAVFLKQVYAEPDAIHRAEPIGHLDALAKFLKAHKAHKLTASLRAAK